MTDTRLQWELWIVWSLATCLSASIGGLAPDVLVLGLPNYFFVDDNFIVPVCLWGGALLLILGPLVGLTQARVLTYFGLDQDGWQWVRLSGAGVGLAIAALMVFGSFEIPVAGFVVSGALFGCAQWFIMRNYFRNAGWWIVANGVGWLIGPVVGLALQDLRGG